MECLQQINLLFLTRILYWGIDMLVCIGALTFINKPFVDKLFDKLL